MTSKLKRIIKNKRVILLLVVLVLAILIIRPVFDEGVAIRTVERDSAAAQALPNPIPNPQPNIRPTAREVIIDVNGNRIRTVADYFDAIETINPGEQFTIQTNRQTYFLEQKLINKTITEDGEEIIIQEYQEIGLNVYPRPQNNIRKGLDLEGGTRVLLQPQEQISSEDLDMTVRSMEQRLNAYGLSDISVRSTTDLFGNVFISAEIPGVNEEEVTELLSQQGRFEGIVGDVPVFIGGSRDIVFIYTTGENARITRCDRISQEEHFCAFEFGITLSQDAARRMAQATENLTIIGIGQEGYLSENITLVLDGEVVDELRISASLQGQIVTQIRITGSSTGINERDARANAMREMRNLQAILSTGSLPVTLDVVKTDSISPALGAGFIRNAIIAGIIAIIAVSTIISIRYREWRVTIPIIITIISEVILILGFAALIGWRMDIAAIAAIIIAVGSGVDDQIVISDETLKKKKKTKKEEEESWKKRVGRAFFIIMASYFTLAVAMVPLLFAGAGLLKGFALTTIIGISMGVFITRPAFAKILEIIVED